MLGELQPWHIILVLLAFVLLFGSKKLPDTARSLGRSLRMFKSEMNQMRDENSTTRAEPRTSTPQAAASQASAQPTVAPATPQAAAETPAPPVAEPVREPVVDRPRA